MSDEELYTLCWDLRMNITQRQFDDMMEETERLLSEYGWVNILPTFKKDPTKRNWNYGEYENGLVMILGIQPISALDVDFVVGFDKIDAYSLEELRQQAQSRAMKILAYQVRHRHTYFLSVEEMSTSQYAYLVPDVVEARRRELDRLPDDLDIVEFANTYYGFLTLFLWGSNANTLYYPDILGRSFTVRRTIPFYYYNEFARGSFRKSKTGHYIGRCLENLMWLSISNRPRERYQLLRSTEFYGPRDFLFQALVDRLTLENDLKVRKWILSMIRNYQHPFYVKKVEGIEV